MLRKNGSTLFEVVIMMAILSLVLASFFSVIGEWAQTEKNLENHVNALAFSREWIEWILNIRNTNWLRFASNRSNCWDTLNYDMNCVAGSYQSIQNGNYQIWNENWLWKLTQKSPWDKNNIQASFDQYRIYKNEKWWSSHTWNSTPCTQEKNQECQTKFARVITISNKTPTSLTARSTVYWKEKNNIKNTFLEVELTNWKSAYDK